MGGNAMDKVAFLTEHGYVYWHSIFLLLGILAAAALFLALGLAKKTCPVRALLAVPPLALAASLYLGRLIHWYCRFESYESLSAALGHLGSGGFSLIGAFLGVLLACLLARLLGLTRDLPGLLDAAAPAGALGIALGRLGDLFTVADRGKILIADPALQRLPWASVVTNAAGETEWCLATFCFQSIFAAGLCLLLLPAFFLPRKRQPQREAWTRGNVAALFLLVYCAGQIVLDSTRYDALFLRSNGFVSLEQILCALTLAGLLTMYAVRSVRTHDLRPLHLLSWLAALGCLGGAGYMEYYVQRHGDRYLLAYGVMSACLLVYVLLAWITYRSILWPSRAVQPRHLAK